ncbi:MAG TPA: Uma2 family endonuclease [Polyangiaceae bacterium]|jgi:Uma2 family endonuclease
MAQAADRYERVSPAEYLAFERRSEQKHEYSRGRVFAMAGASPKHNLVGANLLGALRDKLRAQPSVVLPSDQHVYVEATDLGTYPDVVVFCGAAKYHGEFPQSLVNPSILVEVLSPSTEAYDRGAKFDHYAQIESLREYVLTRPSASRWTITSARQVAPGASRQCAGSRPPSGSHRST